MSDLNIKHDHLTLISLISLSFLLLSNIYINNNLFMLIDTYEFPFGLYDMSDISKLCFNVIYFFS